jgi:hypothetical protein
LAVDALHPWRAARFLPIVPQGNCLQAKLLVELRAADHREPLLDSGTPRRQTERPRRALGIARRLR